MDNRIKTWLHDILNAIDEIDSFFAGDPKDFEKYQNDIKTKRAVERNIEIIGEAINRILKQDNTIIINNARNIVGTRNLIIHSYDTISDELIWSIIIVHLPKLKEEIKAIFNFSPL